MADTTSDSSTTINSELLEKLKQSTIFKQMSKNITQQLEELEMSHDSNNDLEAVLGMYFLDRDGRNICDCINRLNSTLERLLQAQSSRE